MLFDVQNPKKEARFARVNGTPDIRGVPEKALGPPPKTLRDCVALVPGCSMVQPGVSRETSHLSPDERQRCGRSVDSLEGNKAHGRIGCSCAGNGSRVVRTC
jgi:hypothetical protein